MSFTFAPFAFALLQAIGIHAGVLGRDGLITRPNFVSKAVLGRLRTGIRALEAFLRRVLILMALEIEHDLVYVHQPENMARAKAVMPRMKTYSLAIYPAGDRAGYSDNGQKFFDQSTCANTLEWDRDTAIRGPVLVPIGCWLERLDHLHALAKDPIAKARRLAFSLARSRHGLLMAPDENPRMLRRWGTEASAIHDAMAYQIMQKSRSRPPPLPPPRRGLKPTITLL